MRYFVNSLVVKRPLLVGCFFCQTLWLLLPLRAVGAELALDFDELDTAGVVPLTAAGFQSFTIDTANAIVTTPVVRSYGALTVTLSSSNPAFGFDDRQRGTPLNDGIITTADLLRDFAFSRAGAASVTDGLDLTIAGLRPNTLYTFTIWSFDSGSAGTRVSDWFLNGNELVSNYTFDGRVLPTSDTQYQFSMTGLTDSTGQAIIGGRRDDTSLDSNNAASFGVFLNAIQVDLIPEPTAVVLLIGAITFAFPRRHSFSPDKWAGGATPAPHGQLTRYCGTFIREPPTEKEL
jgi:hypothetical protein